MKIIPFEISKVYFNDLLDGVKTFDVRKNKASIGKGDLIVYQETGLTEYLNATKTGREIIMKIVYESTFMQRNGYKVFGLVPATYEDLCQIYDEKKATLMALGYDYELIRKMNVHNVDVLYAKEKKKGLFWEKLTSEN